MTEPKTPQELNEGVAKVLGASYYQNEHGTIYILDGDGFSKGMPPQHAIGSEWTWVFERKCYGVEFKPATKTADALWAIDKYCDHQTNYNAYDRHTWDFSSDIYPENKHKGKYLCSISSPEETWDAFGQTFPETLCRAILEAAERPPNAVSRETT